MKRFTVIFPIVVFGLLAIAFVAARMRASAREVPVFRPGPEVALEPLAPPRAPAQLNGRVVDIEGLPVAGVSLYFRAGGRPFWEVSDELGRFSFEDVPDEELELALLVWGRPPHIERIRPGAAVELVAVPALPGATTLPDVAHAPLFGRVANPLGRSFWDPVGYEVAFLPRGGPGQFGGAVERRVQCDRGGAFTLPDLALASYDVHVLPSWASGTLWPDLIAPGYSVYDHGTGEGGPLLLVLRCGGIDAALAEGSGGPLEGALVLLSDVSDANRLWPPQSTDPAGRFRFLDLPPGHYRLSVRAGEGALVEDQLEVLNGQIRRPELAPIAIRAR